VRIEATTAKLPFGSVRCMAQREIICKNRGTKVHGGQEAYEAWSFVSKPKARTRAPSECRT